MREKLQTLPLAELKEMARNQGIKGISSLRKAEIIDLLCAAAEKNPEVKPTEIRKEEKRQAQAQDSAQPRQETVKPRQDNTQSRPQESQDRQESRSQEPRRNTNRSYDNKYSASKSQQNRPHTGYSQNQGSNQQFEGGERTDRCQVRYNGPVQPGYGRAGQRD